MFELYHLARAGQPSTEVQKADLVMEVPSTNADGKVWYVLRRFPEGQWRAVAE